MSLALTDIAALQAARGGANRIIDPAARELARRTAEAHKADALRDAERAAERFTSYTPAQELAIRSLREVHWPRARAVRSARSQVREVLARHFDKYDDSISLFEAEVYDLLYKDFRLTLLLELVYARTASVGMFPISRGDMRTDVGTLFIKSAWKRHFTFSGGRDAGSAEFTPADIVQGAFIRAIEAGDTVNGVPAYGPLFRHIQSERAHLTRVSNAEYAARKRAALGEVVPDDTIWEDTKHTLRLLGTRRYPSLDQHRRAVAIAHRDAELELLDDAVTHSARQEALDGASDKEFHVVLARVLMNGATLEEVSRALGLTVATIQRNAFESQAKSLRHIATGIDHAERSVDMHNRAEHEREVAEAQERHAALMRERYIAAQTAHYAMSRVA